MNSYFKNYILIIFILSLFGCNQEAKPIKSKEEQRKKVEMITSYGTMVIELYNETPLHRDNFINLSNNKAYDSLLFHRVIKDFMIQGGDPDSRKAQPNDTLGEGDAPYVVKAEFNNKLFHKKGVLAAARDNNLERASSGMQFYIVQGKVFNDSLLNRSEEYINKNIAKEYFKNNLEKNPLLDSMQNAFNNGNFERYKTLQDSVYNLAKSEENFKPYAIPEEHQEVYKSTGGTPHLDQNYTVFGEVIKGFEVLDSIASVKTNDLDRPINDVRILSVRLQN